MKVHVWHCGNGHTFTFGGENWHYEDNQGVLDDGAPIPMYCTEDWTDADDSVRLGYVSEGEPCLDSSSLIYD